MMVQLKLNLIKLKFNLIGAYIDKHPHEDMVVFNFKPHGASRGKILSLITRLKTIKVLSKCDYIPWIIKYETKALSSPYYTVNAGIRKDD